MYKKRHFTKKNLSDELIAVLLEKALVSINPQLLERIESKLSNEHNCSFDEILNHPISVKKVLNEFRVNTDEIIDFIKNELVNLVIDKDIRNFIRELEES